MKRRCSCRNPGAVGSVVFQVLVGVATAVAASLVLEAVREARERAALPSAPASGLDVA